MLFCGGERDGCRNEDENNEEEDDDAVCVCVWCVCVRGGRRGGNILLLKPYSHPSPNFLRIL